MATIQLLEKHQCTHPDCNAEAVARTWQRDDDEDSGPRPEYLCGVHVYDFLNAQGVDPLAPMFENT